MKKLIAAAALAATSVLCTSALASPETDTVLATLKAKFPKTQFTSVSETPLPEIFEVVMGKNIAYSDKDGHYFLFGNLYDMDARQDLTAPKREAVNAAAKIDVSTFPIKDAIVRVKGKGTRTIYLFSDPDCPYCKQLEKDTLPAIDDVTIYTFLFPIDSLHPKARGKSEAIWCLPEGQRAAAWDRMMLEGVAPTLTKCSNPMEKIGQLADSLGIRGTPTLISGDGRMLPGAAPAARVESWLNGGK